MMASYRGRKRQIEPSKNVEGSIFKYLKCKEPTAEEIVKSVLGDLIVDVVKQVEKPIEKKHHLYEAGREKFYKQWKIEYPWLCFSGSENDRVMTCTYCTEQKVASIWAREGSSNFQKTSVSRHDISTEHQTAEKKYVKQACMTDSEVNENAQKVESHEVKLFRTVFYAAKEGLPTKQINRLLELQKLNGAEIKFTSLSWDTLTGIQTSICRTIVKELVSEIENSEFFSVMIDESTDLSVQKHLSVCVKFVKDGESVTKFLTNVAVEDGKAHTLVNHLIEILQKYGLNPGKMVSLATDGASTMRPNLKYLLFPLPDPGELGVGR